MLCCFCILQALLKKVKEAQEGRLEQHVPSLPALVAAEKADVLCLQVGLGGDRQLARCIVGWGSSAG